MAVVVKPPSPILSGQTIPLIFLAGSIEMGEAEDWQKEVELSLNSLNVIILNPRRDIWEESWDQDINNPIFREQVEWELNAQDAADLILMYFDPNTLSPITLLELGIFSQSKKLVVCCPEGYWRKGNVDIVCERYNILQVDNFRKLCNYAAKFVEKSVNFNNNLERDCNGE